MKNPQQPDRLDKHVQTHISDDDYTRVLAFQALLPVVVSESVAIRELVRAGLKAQRISKVANGTAVATNKLM